MPPLCWSGHAHYDHLMDVPDVLELGPRRDDDARERHGDESARAPRPAVPTLPVDAFAAIARGRALDPAPGSRFRFMPPARSTRLTPGPASSSSEATWRSRRPRPRSAYGWKEGQADAFLIDVLADDGETPLLRIHYQHSASTRSSAGRRASCSRSAAWTSRCSAPRVPLVRDTRRRSCASSSRGTRWPRTGRTSPRPARPGAPRRGATDLPELIDRLDGTLPGRYSVPKPGE